MASRTVFQRVFEEYRTDFRRADFPELRLSGFYDLFPEKESAQLTIGSWPGRWPEADKPGVYLFFDPMLELLYVGKASWGSSIGARLSTYGGYGPDKKGFVLKDTWEGDPRYVAVIWMTGDYRFEAPALEEFLVTRLRPIDNTIGAKQARSVLHELP
jgi:hypothetical protein